MHCAIDIKNFLNCLHYSDSPYFFEGSRLDEVNSYSNAFRIAKKTCGLKGVYALDGNYGEKATGKSIIPIIYVCEAESENQAIERHRLVWNQNCVPFLLVVTPKSVRLYPGFKFDTSKQVHGQDQYLEIVKSTNEILEKLSDFTADSIDKGHIWKKWQHQVTPDTRVDQNLLKNLEELSGWLRGNNLPKQTAHSLIGKYVYLRYLRDRDILSDRKLKQWDINLSSVFGRNATVSGFQKLVKKLDQWLNGSIFPVPTEGTLSPEDKHIKKIASVFLGDDPTSGQMHLDFNAYNFGHIPIETLSMVYQQFLHAENRGPSQGAYYTPIHLVNFMLDELDSKKMLKKGMKVFDPACGSGAFIVQCFRRLIEREISASDKLRLKPSELRRLLVDHIFGVDLDEDACGVTELSLVLTLLDYVDPPDLEAAAYQHFKLPALRDKNIFFCENGFFDDESIQLDALSGVKFDWIVGNPPWNQLSKKQDTPAADQAALNWINNNKKEYPVNKNQIAEAFVWKTSLYLSGAGVTGLLLPGKTLFKIQENAIDFRKHFFGKMDVWCIVNFANLRHLLFKGAVHPAVAVFYKACQDNSDKPRSILTYAPFAMNQISQYDHSQRGRKKLWTVLINADEMREIPYRDVLSGSSFPWKMAMWGTMRDKYLLVSLQKAFDSLSTFIKNHDLEISQGLELRYETAEEEIEPLYEVAGKDQLNMEELEGCGKIFSFPIKALKTIPASMAYVRKGRGKIPLKICHPPHIIIDANRRFFVFSDHFIVVPPRQIGISGDTTKTTLLKALALYLSSDFVQYQQYLSSPSWGIGMERLTKQDLESLPVPLDNLSSGEIEEWAKLYDELVQKSTNIIAEEQFFKFVENPVELEPLINKMNEKVNALLGLKTDERCLVHDFVTTRMKFNDGAIPKLVTDLASKAEIMAYSKTLKKILDDFLDADIKNQHQITATYSSSMVLLSIKHLKNSPTGSVIVKKIADPKLKDELKKLEKNLEFEQGQWIYFRKNLKLFHGRTTYFIKSRQRLGWLQSQAFTDADDFIAEKLITTGND